MHAVSGQTPPAQCAENLRIVQDHADLYITPRAVNCFSCALDTLGDVSWQIATLDGRFWPPSPGDSGRFNDTSSGRSVRSLTEQGNFLVLEMPDDYILPGMFGRRTIQCTSDVNGQTLQARLASPGKNTIAIPASLLLPMIIVLRQPLFSDTTVDEGELLEISCVTRNIPDIITFCVLDPNEMLVTTILGVFSVSNVTRSYAGTYRCVVQSTIDNSTVNETSTVIIQCKLLATPIFACSLYVAITSRVARFAHHPGVPDQLMRSSMK